MSGSLASSRLTRWAAFSLLLLSLSCVHLQPPAAPPPETAPRAEREKFYEDYRIAEPPGIKVWRWCADAWNCACVAPCVPAAWSPPIVLGNGTLVRSAYDLGPLVPETEASEALALHGGAQDMEYYLAMGGGCLFAGAFLLVVLPADIGGDPVFYTRMVLAGLAIGGIGLAAVGMVVSYVVSFFAREAFFELYNPSLRKTLHLDKPPSPEPPATPEPASPPTSTAALVSKRRMPY